MKTLVTALALTFCMTGAAFADNKPMTPQQQKMSDCSKQSAGKTGDDRKAAMKACLSGTPATAAAPAAPQVDKNGKPLTPQQIKMKTCASQGKGKKGDDYKKFMSQCMKG